MCGIALALAPNDACYIPLGHKQSGDGAGLFAAGLAPDQITTTDALAALRPVLESAGHPQDRVQHQVQRGDVRTTWRRHQQPGRRATDVVCARRRPQCARARRAGRTMARPRHPHPWRIDRQRQEQAELRSGRDRPGNGVLGRRRRCDPAIVAGSQTAPDCRAHDIGLRDAGTAAGRRAGAHGTTRHLDRSPGAVAAIRRFRPDRRAGRSRNSGDRRRADQCRQPQADRRHHFRQDGTARRQQDQDRRVVDLGADSR